MEAFYCMVLTSLSAELLCFWLHFRHCSIVVKVQPCENNPGRTNILTVLLCKSEVVPFLPPCHVSLRDVTNLTFLLPPDNWSSFFETKRVWIAKSTTDYQSPATVECTKGTVALIIACIEKNIPHSMHLNLIQRLIYVSVKANFKDNNR